MAESKGECRGTSDEELLLDWLTGNRQAADALLDRHFPALLRFFSNKAPQAVEDLVQETMLECVRSAGRFRGASSFRTFLFAVAHNVLKRHYRSASRVRDQDDVALLSWFGTRHSPTSLVAGAEEQRLLLRALRRLPIEDQVILELKYWEGLSSAEVAEVLAVPPGTVRTRQMAARERLQAELEKLADSNEIALSTLHGFDTWVARVRELAPTPR